MRCSSARIDAARRAVSSSPTAVASCSIDVYVAISSASVAAASLAFLRTFSSPPLPRSRSNGVLPSASACAATASARPMPACSTLPPSPSSRIRVCSRSACSRVSPRCLSSPVRYVPRGVIAICDWSTRTSASSLAWASFRYWRIFSFEVVMGSALPLLAAREHRLVPSRTAVNVARVNDLTELAARSAPKPPAGIVIARSRDGAVEVAAAGSVEPDAVFELGSITKAVTGLLLADAVVRGEVALDTTLDRCLPGARPLALGDLASHTAGLPRLAWAFVRRSFRRRSDPYAGTTVPELVDDLAGVRLRRRRRPRYSNLGAALLGQALAARAGAPYEELVA